MSKINKTINPKLIKHVLNINAPADYIFSLLCPVIEYNWIPGWKCKLIHFPNGKIEKGCMFTEIMSAPFLMGSIASKTKWTSILYDENDHRIHFRLDNAISSSLYKVELASLGKNRTECSFELNYSPINMSGNTFIERNGEYKIQFLISAISSMLKQYCESGVMISSKGSERLSFFLKSLSRTEKIKLLLNKTVMYLTINRNKKRFLAGKTISTN